MQINTNALNTFGPSMFKAKRQKFGVGTLILLLVMGTVFIVIGFTLFKSTKINANWKRVDGTVVGASTETSGNGGTTYAAVIGYKVNGQTYKVTNNTSSSSYPYTGAVSQVAYDPSNPQDAKVVASAGSKVILLIFPAIGILMLVLGPLLFVRSLRRSEDINKLQRTGQKIPGVITDIQSSANGSNRSGNGFRIIVSATGPGGSVQQYTSDILQGIGGLAMTDFRTNPVPIDVYVDPTNPQNYYVDVSEVPNITPERIAELIQTVTQRKTTTEPSPEVVSLQPTEALTATPAPQPTPPSEQLQTPPAPPQQT